ncbi:MAG: hypothetical protein ACXADW_19105 [Candidatus Hodarchaeales archaeon]
MTIRDTIAEALEPFHNKFLGTKRLNEIVEAVVEALDTDKRSELQSQKNEVEVIEGKKSGNKAIVSAPPKPPEPPEQKPKVKMETQAVISWPEAPYDDSKGPEEQDDTFPVGIQKRVP